MKKIFIYSLVVGGTVLISGCSSGGSGANHTIRPPDPVGSYKVPSTKAEKIAAIQKAHIPNEQKKQAIDKVNSEPGP